MGSACMSDDERRWRMTGHIASSTALTGHARRWYRPNECSDTDGLCCSARCVGSGIEAVCPSFQKGPFIAVSVLDALLTSALSGLCSRHVLRLITIRCQTLLKAGYSHQPSIVVSLCTFARSKCLCSHEELTAQSSRLIMHLRRHRASMQGT